MSAPSPRSEQGMSVFSPLGKRVLLAWLLATTSLESVIAQSPSDNDTPSLNPKQSIQADPLQAESSQEESIELEKWIAELASPEFKVRERASGNLLQLGESALPALRDAIENSPDPETRQRAGQIVQQMTQGNLQAKIAQFLAGKNEGIAGWHQVQGYLGDSQAIRELFVEMMLKHPDFVESLEATPRERSLALEKLLVDIQQDLRTLSGTPEPVDAFALLILGNDLTIEWNPGVESIVLRILQRPVASLLRRDSHLSGPFINLLNKWITRSTLANREDVLVQGMLWDLPATLPLALKTLNEVQATETIATCFQAISKFGEPRHANDLRRYLEDERLVALRGFERDATKTQVRDMAMLTIAMIHRLELKEIGMSHIQTHPSSGFIRSDLAYDSDPEASREKARARIDQLLRESTKAVESP